MKIKYDKVAGFVREMDVEMIDDIVVDETDEIVMNDGNIVLSS